VDSSSGAGGFGCAARAGPELHYGRLERRSQMSPIQLSIRALARVDAEGRIPLPVNIRRALGLRQNQALELRTIGNGRGRRLMVRPQYGR
jgi:hypothetical protein